MLEAVVVRGARGVDEILLVERVFIVVPTPVKTFDLHVMTEI